MSKCIEELNKQREEHENAIKEIDAKILEIQSKVETPKYGEKYYYVSDVCIVKNVLWTDESVDNRRFKCGNCFKTYEEADNALFKQTLRSKLERFNLENGGSKIIYDCKTRSYYIYYDYEDKVIYANNHCVCSSGELAVFSTREIAENAIEEFKDDLIKYFEFFAVKNNE